MSALNHVAPAVLARGVDRAARLLEVEAAAVWAVFEVESAGAPFLEDGRPTILFEAHKFSQATGGQYDRTHPNISAPVWDRSLYGATGAHQWDRLEAAAALDRRAALESASWGAFQIMGFNHRACGFMDVYAFVASMRTGFDAQVEAFVRFILATGGLADKLRARDWAGFARIYNGPGYAKNRYDAKLASAYARGLARELQRALNARDATPRLTVDGAIGPATRAAWAALVDAPFPDSTKAALRRLGDPPAPPIEAAPNPQKGSSTMQLSTMWKAIAAFVGGALVTAAGQFLGVDVPPELQAQAVATFGLDQTLVSAGGGFVTALLTWFAPKNAAKKKPA